MSNARELAELGGALAGGGGIGMRNRIINGDMRIDQRNNGSIQTNVGSGTQFWLADRFRIGGNGTGIGRMSFQQVSDAPSGFLKSGKITVTTAQSSFAAGDLTVLSHIIEGTNIIDMAWGTSSAKPAVLSFWAKASVTGSYTVSINGPIFYTTNYTINSANTWEYKTIIIPGPTTGTWSTDTNTGIRIDWNLGSGSNVTGTGGTWSGTTTYSVTGSNQLMSTLGATLQLTGIQFEAGNAATDFEFRHYTLEEMLCRRYYYRLRVASAYANAGVGRAYSATNGQCVVALPVSMRAAPTGGYSALTDWNAAQNSGNITALSPAAQFSLDYRQMTIDITCTTTLGNILILNANNTTNAWIDWSAEL